MPRSVAELRADARRLVLGMLAAQAAALATTPLLTRLYGPEQFGIYGVFLAMIAALAPVAALRVDAALPLATDDAEAKALVRIGILAGALVALAALLLPALGVGPFARAGTEGLAWWLLPIGVWLTGAYQLGSAWQVRRAQAGRAALGRASQGVGAALAQSALGVLGFGASGLPVGDVAGRALAVAIVLPEAVRAGGSGRLHLRQVASRYQGFATTASAAALINSFNASLPVLLVGALAGPAAAGLLVLAQRVASLPATLLSSAVSQVFTVELARTAGGSARVSLFDTVLRDVLRTVLGPAIAIALLSPLAFAPAFGETWRQAGLVTSALVPFYILQTCSASTIAAVDVLRLHAQRVIREIVFLVGATAVLLATLRAGWSLPTIAMALSVFGCGFYIASLWWVRGLLRVGERA